MTEDEIKSKQEETLNNLKKYNDSRKTGIVEDTEGNPTVVTQWTEELKNVNEHPKLKLIHREETFFNDDPNEYTEIEVVPYTEEDNPDSPMQEWLDDQDELNKERGITIGEKAEEAKFGQLSEPVTEMTGDTVNPVMERPKPYGVTPVCEFCGNLAYQGQLHGLGYCKEKVQYEQ